MCVFLLAQYEIRECAILMGDYAYVNGRLSNGSLVYSSFLLMLCCRVVYC